MVQKGSAERCFGGILQVCTTVLVVNVGTAVYLVFRTVPIVTTLVEVTG